MNLRVLWKYTSTLRLSEFLHFALIEEQREDSHSMLAKGFYSAATAKDANYYKKPNQP